MNRNVGGVLRAVTAVLAGSLLVVAAVSMVGCDSLARSQGKFPVVAAMGENALGSNSYPLDERLYVYPVENGVRKTSGAKVPLIKIAYRSPWDGKLVNYAGSDGKPNDTWNAQSYYMVIDVTNAVKDPSLGTTDTAEFKVRLKLIAELLLTAGDWNGDVYWRHLTTFLETYHALDSAARAGLGAAIAATFISPVLGASLAGGALVIDTLVSDFTGSLNVDEYASLREAASTYRKKIKGEVFQAIETAKPEACSVNGVFHLAYDYAFTYSIKGALYAVGKENAELKNLLITGDSPWKQYFKDEIKEHRKQLLREGKITGEEAARLKKEIDIEDEIATARLEQEKATEQRKAEEAKQKLQEAKNRAHTEPTPPSGSGT